MYTSNMSGLYQMMTCGIKNVENLKYEKLITFYIFIFYFYFLWLLNNVSMIYGFAVLTGGTLNFDIFIGSMGISIIFRSDASPQRIWCLMLVMNDVSFFIFPFFSSYKSALILDLGRNNGENLFFLKVLAFPNKLKRVIFDSHNLLD